MSSTMDKLWAQHDAVQKKIEDTAKKDPLNFRADSGDQKILAAAQKEDDALLAMHEDTFTKQIEAWKKTEDKLIALGQFGAEARAQHEHAYTVFVEDESRKRIAAADAHMNTQLAGEREYFAKQQAAADSFNNTAKGREDKRFQDEVIVYQAKYKAAIKDHHNLTLEEQEGFETTRENIIKAHQERAMRDENSVANVSKLLRAGEFQDAMTMAQAMTAGLTQHSRTAFELNKAASLANAAIKGKASIVNAYEDGTKWGGVFGGALEATAAALFVGAQVAAIESTQFGGGGASNYGGGGGGVPSQATSPGLPVTQTPATSMQQTNATSQTTVHITVQALDPSSISDAVLVNLGNKLAPAISQNLARGGSNVMIMA